MKFTLIAVEYPDYFHGSSLPYISVMVWKEITKEEITSSIKCHIWEDDRFPDVTEGELEEMLDEFILSDEPFIDSSLPSVEDEEVKDYPNLYITWGE